jgi:Na+/melibiose symporter-like transporter
VFGSLVTRTALPFTAILVLDASPLDMAFLSVTDLVAGFAAGVLAAPWLDRVRRRPLLLAADLGRAAVLGLIPVAAAGGWLRLEMLYAVALVTGALDTIFAVAQDAYVPALVAGEALVSANARLSASASGAEMLAFATGGWLVQWLGPPHAIAIDAATFLLSAACLAGITTPEQSPVVARESVGLRHEAIAGVAVIARDPLLRAVSLADAATAFAFRVFSAVFLLFVTRELGLAPGVLGLIFATGGLASLGGALVAAHVGRALGSARAVALGIGVLGAALLLVPLARDAAFLGVGLLVAQQLLGDGAATVASVHEVTLRQSRVAPQLRGRANAAKRLLDTIAMLAGALAGGGHRRDARAPLGAGARGHGPARCRARTRLHHGPARGRRVTPPRRRACLPDAPRYPSCRRRFS